MNIFEKLKKPRIKKNAFDLSHERKMSFDMTEIIPILVEEVVPSDKFSVNTELFMRLAPMVAPVMHRVNVFIDFFYVPNRILWHGWERYISGAGIPQNSTTGNPASMMGIYDGTVLPLPSIEYNYANQFNHYFDVGSLSDYFGIPTIESMSSGQTTGVNVCLLPYLAYQTIFWEYYRHQYLQCPEAETVEGKYTLLSNALEYYKTVYDTSITGYESAIMSLRNHNWESDYFTSSLPFTQLGTPITFGTNTTLSSAPVTLVDGNTDPQKVVDRTGGVAIDPNGTLEAVSENYTTFNVNDLRKAFQVQRWMERNARAGVRYIEQLFAHFGVRSSDARLQRPEYLGGGKAPVVISEVLQTAPTSTSDTKGIGNMAGHGYSASSKWRFRRYFEEHGYVIGLMTVMPRTSYQQGMQRTFMRHDQLDFYFPEFSHLGEQKINMGELFLQPNSTANYNAFGYTPRYQEYRQRQSTVHGHFKSDTATNIYDNLQNWHLGRVFQNAPQLNSEFVTATAETADRIWQYATASGDDHLIAQIVNHITAIRPLPKFGTAGLVDHFS